MIWYIQVKPNYYLWIGVCGIKRYGSESELKKPNRTFLEFRKSWNSIFARVGWFLHTRPLHLTRTKVQFSLVILHTFIPSLPIPASIFYLLLSQFKNMLKLTHHDPFIPHNENTAACIVPTHPWCVQCQADCEFSTSRSTLQVNTTHSPDHHCVQFFAISPHPPLSQLKFQLHTPRHSKCRPSIPFLLLWE